MSRVIWRPKFQNVFFITAVGLMLFALVRFPSEAVTAARNGVDLCLNVILPSLFPFFVLSTLCIDLGLVNGLGKIMEKIMNPLFRVNGACAGAFLLGIVGGYPVGARTAIELYKNGQCSKTEAERLLSFCNNSGPAFILGVVGAGIFSSSAAGLWLYGAHIAASVLVGMLFRFYGKDVKNKSSRVCSTKVSPMFSESFTSAVKNALSSTMNICGFVIFFTVVIRLLFLSGVISYLSGLLAWLMKDMNVSETMVESMLTGVIEMTSGVWCLRDMASSLGSKLCMAAFILGWAGLSVHCQVLSFIGSSGISVKTYFFGKLLHGIFSAAIILLVSNLLGWDAPVSAYLASQVTTIAKLDFSRALTVSGATALCIWLILTLISLIFVTKESRKSKQYGV